MDSNICVICLEQMDNSTFTLKSCKHTFHSHCIHQWLSTNSTCPICRDFIYQVFKCSLVKYQLFPGIKKTNGFMKIENKNLIFSHNNLNYIVIPINRIFRFSLLNKCIQLDVKLNSASKMKKYTFNFYNPNISLKIFNYLNEFTNNLYLDNLRITSNNINNA